VAARFCDELDFGFGWIVPDPPGFERASHALADGARWWLIDPVESDGVDERLAALGEPAGVLQLLDRHNRDCAAFAARLGVPLLVTPFAGVPGSPFEVVPVVRRRWWHEIALWWPERRVLVCADVLGSGAFFRLPDERLGVHLLRRLAPPRRLARLEPEHVLFGHGEGVHGPEAAPAVREAVRTARRRLPRQLARAARLYVRT
jgi:hypothetical protein